MHQKNIHMSMNNIIRDIAEQNTNKYRSILLLKAGRSMKYIKNIMSGANMIRTRRTFSSI